MFKNYLKITFRNLWKNKVFVLVNILGMGTAIGCCIVAYLNYDFNVNFDQNIKNIEQIYRVDVVRSNQDRALNYGISPAPLGNHIKENFSDVDKVVRYMSVWGDFKKDNDLFSNSFEFVDEGFFEIFSFNFLYGSSKDLGNKSNIFISKSQAMKFFGKENAVGERLTHFTPEGSNEYTVAGIFENMPLNSSFGMVTTIAHIDNYFDMNREDDVENNWTYWTTLFLKVKDPTRISQIEDQLEKYIDIQNEARLDFQVEQYFLEPMVGMGHRAAQEEIYSHWLLQSMPPPAVIVPSIMAILILLIACFNFTNTSIAISSKRLKEIGLRKVMGGLRKQLIIQFLLENMLLCFFALMIGLLLAFFLVPAYSQMWEFLDLKLNLLENFEMFLFLVGILLITGLIAGSYPAFYISGFEPASILKNTLKIGGTNRLTNALLTLQFAISLLAIILGFIFYQNAEYQKSIDFGYDKSGTISMYVSSEDDYKALERLLRQNPKVEQVAASEHQIMRSLRNDPIKVADKEYDSDILHVGENYLEAMNFTILEGRTFRENSQSDFKESVLISEDFVKTFDLDQPIGTRVTWMDTVDLYVVGVVKDVYMGGLWEPIEPLMIRYAKPENYRYLTIKASPGNLVEVNEYAKEKWIELFPDKMYSGIYLDSDLSDTSELNGNIIKMFGFLGGIATLLSAIGLFSLVSLSIVKRTKEIGVRKVLGASIAHIIGLLNKTFVIILLIASILGSIMSYYLSDMMMASIWTYHINPEITSFLMSIIFILFVSFLTIGVKVFRAASANPVNALRAE